MMVRRDFFIGVDGGGTHSRARLRSADGRLLGEGQGGPGNIRLGPDLSWSNICAAIDGALAAAGLTSGIFPRTSIGLGLAGVVDERDMARVEQQAKGFASVAVSDDAQTACLGAFRGDDGAVLIVGTGCAAHAVIEGRHAALFGWGFAAGDRGSGAVLGRDAVSIALDSFDGLVAASPLTDAILQRIGTRRSDIIAWTSAAKPRDFGAMAPLVVDMAAVGDMHATRLVRAAAQSIEEMMRQLMQRGARRVCLTGGLSEAMRPWLAPWVDAVLALPERDAVEGALLLAGMPVPIGV